MSRSKHGKHYTEKQPWWRRPWMKEWWSARPFSTLGPFKHNRWWKRATHKRERQQGKDETY